MGVDPVANAKGDNLLLGGSVDPRVIPISAPRGSVYIYAPNDASDPQILQKTDDGSTTSWDIYTTGMATDFSNHVASVVDVDLGTHKLLNVVDPTDPQDAATKKYVDDSVPADTDALTEGVSNLYFQEAPNDGTQYARKNLGWEAVAAAAAGANQALSNLTSPTAINQNLIHGTIGTNWNIETTGGGAGSGNLTMKAGTPTSGVFGDINIQTGNSGTSLPSGDINLTIPFDEFAAAQGDINLTVGGITGGTPGAINIEAASQGVRFKGDLFDASNPISGYKLGRTTNIWGGAFLRESRHYYQDTEERLLINPLFATTNIQGKAAKPFVVEHTGAADMILQHTLPGEDVVIKLADGAGTSATMRFQASDYTVAPSNFEFNGGASAFANGNAIVKFINVAFLQMPSWANAPVTGLVDGAVYYDNATNKLRVRAAGVWDDLNSGGAAGANTSLSNLTNPVSFNQNLIFATGINATVATPLNGAGNSGIMALESGQASSSSGGLDLKTGNSTGASSGSISIKTGQSGGGLNAGSILIETGFSVGSGSGSVSVKSSGALLTGGTPGAVNIETGNPVSGTAGIGTGDINITTGAPNSGGQRGAVIMDALFARMPRLSAAPTGGLINGELYYNTSTNKLQLRAGGAWVDLN